MTNPDQQEPGLAAEDAADEANKESGAAVSFETEAEALAFELESAKAEIERHRDATLRAEAEMQNLRRRTERDIENAHKYGLDRFIQSLLPVIDSLEKAIEAAEQSEGAELETNKAIIEGVGLCQKMLLDVLGKESVAVVNPVGEPFDPNLHQAMTMVENPDMEPNSVVMVMQKGYTLNGRLVRPALVMVSKAPA